MRIYKKYTLEYLEIQWYLGFQMYSIPEGHLSYEKFENWGIHSQELGLRILPLACPPSKACSETEAFPSGFTEFVTRNGRQQRRLKTKVPL